MRTIPVYLWLLAALAALCAALYFTDASASTEKTQPAKKMQRFKGHGPEWWHWQYQLERRDHRQTAKHLKRKTTRDVSYAIALASSTFNVSIAELWAVARCETGGTFSPYARNQSSSASGLFQFLDSTWASQGIRGFSVFDPVANALGAARIVARQGWRQWSCQP